MLTLEEAKIYRDELHPAFAGYLHDGEITKRDTLASIINLMKTGVIIPEFEGHMMTKKIISLRKTAKEPRYTFEQTIVNLLFDTNDTVTVSQVQKLIQSGVIQDVLKKNNKAIAQFPMVKKKLQFFNKQNEEITFTLSNEKVDSYEKAIQLVKVFSYTRYIEITIVVSFVILSFIALDFFLSILFSNK